MSALRWWLCAAIVCCLAAPAIADAPAPTPKPQPDPNQKICRREENTGSRLPGPKVCHTRAEWKQIDADRAAGIQGTTTRGDFKTQP